MGRTKLALLGILPLLWLTAVTPTKTASAQPQDDSAEKDTDDGGAEADAPAATSQAESEAIDLEALRVEYLKLRDQLFRSRARAASVASALYSSKVEIRLEYGSARYYTVDRATIRLDGANIFDDSDGKITKDKAPRFSGYVAPGRHKLSFRIAATGKDDQRFTSIIENTIMIQAQAGSNLVVVAKAKDGGNIPYQWKRKTRGSYKLHLDVDLHTVKRADGKKKVAKKK